MRVAVAIAIAVAVAVVPTTGCTLDGCDASLMYGLIVDVTGPSDGAATVTFRDGSFVEQPPSSFGNKYMGAGERAGTYEVTVEAPGFQTIVFRDVVVEDGDCHVEQVRLDAQLQPL